MRTKLWKTRDGTKIRIMDMTDSHLLNAYRTLIRFGIAKKDAEELAHLSGGQPSGEMAQDAFDAGFDELLKSDWTDHAPDIWEDLQAEIFHRELKEPEEKDL